ncbi:sulfotransferase family 2 domain-containing protein [Sphingobium boeckii]|uniref:Sulfotransferase family protein n=1 Tax=Sphingobium boeckii TaxID=1082345 RepID=A0A7W9AKF4_9SPHN|nr:sulfotransferase family 2 domain-containing protein [Sphingobium boeckii]MBB5687314.1 hypothetical protein [Sphingobium boeckii]
MKKQIERWIAHSLFDVHLRSDFRERLCDMGWRLPLDGGRRARLGAIRAAGALFIHIPKNAGTSISNALYGRQIKHASLRYYESVAPDLLENVPSFAILRDPVQRFLSAYHFGRAGGSRLKPISEPFATRYRAFRSIDDALDHLESAASLYHVDHIFRPQSWYISRRDGTIAIDRLLMLEDGQSVARFLKPFDIHRLEHLNRGAGDKIALSPHQLARVQRLYALDFALVDFCRNGPPMRNVAAIAEAARRRESTG